MTRLIPLVLAAALTTLLASCGTVGQAYARQHPELSPEHRQIFMTGKVPDGMAVAGMTRDQVLMALGSNVTQYTKVDGHDAWVYLRKRLGAESVGVNGTDPAQHDMRNAEAPSGTGSFAASAQPQVRTTIIFEGDKAVKADVSNGGL